MAEIIIKKKIVDKFYPGRVPRIPGEGGILFLGLPNGDFGYETNDKIKRKWDSLNESTQESCIKSYSEKNISLEIIIEKIMK